MEYDSFHDINMGHSHDFVTLKDNSTLAQKWQPKTKLPTLSGIRPQQKAILFAWLVQNTGDPPGKTNDKGELIQGKQQP